MPPLPPPPPPHPHPQFVLTCDSSSETAHLSSTSLFNVSCSHQSDKWCFFSRFGILPHFYQYYLCVILALGYLNRAGLCEVGGGGGVVSLFTFSCNDSVFQWFCTHKTTHRHTYTCVYPNHLEAFDSHAAMFSFLSTSPNVTQESTSEKKSQMLIPKMLLRRHFQDTSSEKSLVEALMKPGGGGVTISGVVLLIMMEMNDITAIKLRVWEWFAFRG